MKLSRLYTDRPAVFSPVEFSDGLNVVLAEIRIPENRKKDTHNLGKSTLARLIDFCFLSSRDSGFFLFKHIERFRDFTFFLEVQLFDGSFVTIRRSVSEATRISITRHTLGKQDLSSWPLGQWNHSNVPFERARTLLDATLDWSDVKPWSYRKGLGYLLRSQDDYRDVFQLKRFASVHSDWKPFLAHILGFNSERIAEHYAKEKELEERQNAEQSLRGELGVDPKQMSKVEGLLLLKRSEAEKKQALLNAFDFRSYDKNATKEVVDHLDEQIAGLNERRYYLANARKKIVQSIKEEHLLFDPESAQDLFLEAGVVFPGQLKRDFEQLIAFNRAITEERRIYLNEERDEIDAELRTVNADLNALGRRRSELLAFLSESDVFNKYKSVSDELVSLRADIISLERQQDVLSRLQDLRLQIRRLSEDIAKLQTDIESDVRAQNSNKDSRFSAIRLHFSEIVEDVIDRKALLSVETNSHGHLEFRTEILDESGNPTSADAGHTYRKLLCVAFDLAVVRGHIMEKFPRFVYHDGVFESLDNRKKENLLAVFREYAGIGLQPIITLIDSDLPTSSDEQGPFFAADEIVVILHDEGVAGRLFRMQAW